MIDLSMVPDFIVEAQEHLEGLESSLLTLERTPDDPEIINDIFRAMHTIKGAAQFVGVERVAELSHKLENLMDYIRQGERELDQDIIDTLIEGKDRISLLVSELDSFQTEKTDINDLLDRIQALEESTPDRPTPPDSKSNEQEYPEEHSESTDESEDDEIKLTDDFKELFDTFDDEESDFTENSEIIAALTDEEPEVKEPSITSSQDNDTVIEEPHTFFEEPEDKDEQLHIPSSPADPDKEKPIIIPEDTQQVKPKEKSSLAGQQDIDIEPLRKEIAKEDSEDELFLIFIEQLQENISLLRGLSESIQLSSNKSSVIGQCSDLISKLYSSANYMGYDWLTRFYAQWIAELEMMDLKLSTGSKVSFDFMDTNLRVISEIFPQVAQSMTENALPDEEAAVPELPPETLQHEDTKKPVEGQEPDEFGELFSSIDEAEDGDFADDSEIIEALSGEEPKNDLHSEPSGLNQTDAAKESDFLFSEADESDIQETETQHPAPSSQVIAQKPTRKVSAPARKKIELPVLQKEIENEDFEDDLVLIFIDQLQDNIRQLQKFAGDFTESTEKSHIIEQCSGLVSKLYSSANYMGYEHLTEFYGQWIAELEMVDLELSICSEVSCDFMNDHINTICIVFPQIKIPEIEQPALEDEQSDQAPDALLSDTEDTGIDDIDETMSPVIAQPDEEEPLPEKLSESDDDSGLEAAIDEFDIVKAAFADQEVETSPEEEVVTYEDLDHLAETFEHDPESVDVNEDKTTFIDGDIYPFAEDSIEEESRLGETDEEVTQESDDLLEGLFDFETDETDPESDDLLSVEEDTDEKDVSTVGDDAFDEPDEEFHDDSDLSEEVDSVSDLDAKRTELFERLSGELDALESEPEEGRLEAIEPESLLALLQDEIENDITDQDLVDIYINQLRDSISTLQNLNADFDQSNDKQKILEQYTIIVDGLRSSSNYMDYQHFERFYRKWLEQISISEEELSLDKLVALPYMVENIDLLMQVFPQLSDVPDEAAEIGDEEEKDDTPEADQAQPLSELPTDEKQLFDKLSTALDIETDKLHQVEHHDALAEDDDQLLFDKLSSALDTSSLDHTPATLKPIDDIINEILTGTGFAQPSRQIIPGQKIVAKPPALPERREDFSDRRLDFTDRRRGLVDRREAETGSSSKVKQSIRVDADKIDFLMNQVGELVVNKSYISQLYQEMNEIQTYYQNTGRLGKDELKPLQDHVDKLNEANISLGRVSSEMQDGVMNVRMMPVSQLFKRCPRLVRDLTHNTNKQVTLDIIGEETQLDKTVIEEVSDPLIHLIRNSIDHGVETVEERRNAGKEETATLRLEAYPDSSNIVIEITDDGRGIDPQRIKEKALEKNLFPAEELDAMSDEELTYLIMTPGFSTAEQTTRTSGRGVGMDVVKTNIEKLNGSIEIESLLGHETMIRVRIPLTLAIIQTLGVKLGSKVLTIPLTSVDETARVRLDDIEKTDGIKTFIHRDVSLPVIQLGEILNIPTEETDRKHEYIVIVKSEGQRAGLVVDKFLGMGESVIKPLADYLRQESGFSGATIKGDGTISLILDIPTLLGIIAERQPTQQQKQALIRQMKGLVHA